MAAAKHLEMQATDGALDCSSGKLPVALPAGGANPTGGTIDQVTLVPTVTAVTTLGTITNDVDVVPKDASGRGLSPGLTGQHFSLGIDLVTTTAVGSKLIWSVFAAGALAKAIYLARLTLLLTSTQNIPAAGSLGMALVRLSTGAPTGGTDALASILKGDSNFDASVITDARFAAAGLTGGTVAGTLAPLRWATAAGFGGNAAVVDLDFRGREPVFRTNTGFGLYFAGALPPDAAISGIAGWIEI